MSMSDWKDNQNNIEKGDNEEINSDNDYDKSLRSWGCLLGQLLMAAIFILFGLLSGEIVRYGRVSSLLVGIVILIVVIYRAISNIMEKK